MSNNLFLRLGETILNDHGIPFDKVVRVDLTVHGDPGDWSEYTAGWSEYPVEVRYVRDGADLRYRDTFEGLWAIVQLLEDIDDAIRAEW